MKPIDATPAEVRERLNLRLMVVRSVWFPTPAELRAWDDSPSPLYIRWLSPTRFELGPRLQSMWASCFCPVWRGTLVGDETTEVHWRWSWPRMTVGLQVMWSVALVGWGIELYRTVSAGETDPVITGFWVILALATASGPWIGTRYGRPALLSGVPALNDALASPAVEEDW